MQEQKRRKLDEDFHDKVKKEPKEPKQPKEKTKKGKSAEEKMDKAKTKKQNKRSTWVICEWAGFGVFSTSPPKRGDWS